MYLRRVRADVLLPWNLRLPLRSDGRSGDVRDDCLFRSVADTRAGDGQLSFGVASGPSYRREDARARCRSGPAEYTQSLRAAAARLCTKARTGSPGISQPARTRA